MTSAEKCAVNENGKFIKGKGQFHANLRGLVSGCKGSTRHKSPQLISRAYWQKVIRDRLAAAVMELFYAIIFPDRVKLALALSICIVVKKTSFTSLYLAVGKAGWPLRYSYKNFGCFVGAYWYNAVFMKNVCLVPPVWDELPFCITHANKGKQCRTGSHLCHRTAKKDMENTNTW